MLLVRNIADLRYAATLFGDDNCIPLGGSPCFKAVDIHNGVFERITMNEEFVRKVYTMSPGTFSLRVIGNNNVTATDLNNTNFVVDWFWQVSGATRFGRKLGSYTSDSKTVRKGDLGENIVSAIIRDNLPLLIRRYTKTITSDKVDRLFVNPNNNEEFSVSVKTMTSNYSTGRMSFPLTHTLEGDVVKLDMSNICTVLSAVLHRKDCIVFPDTAPSNWNYAVYFWRKEELVDHIGVEGMFSFLPSEQLNHVMYIQNEHDTVTTQDFLKTIFSNTKEQSSNELFRLRTLLTSLQTQLLTQQTEYNKKIENLTEELKLLKSHQLVPPVSTGKEEKKEHIVFNSRTCAKRTCTRIVTDTFRSGKLKKQCRQCIILANK